MATKTEQRENIEKALELLESFREYNRMSAEDQELIENLKAILRDTLDA